MIPVIYAWWFSPIVLSFLGCIGPLLSNLEIISPIAAIGITASTIIFAITSIINGAWLVWWKNNRAGFVGLYTGCIHFGGVLAFIITVLDKPMINDITTDLVNPPSILNSSSELTTEQLAILRAEYSQIKPKIITATAEKTFDNIKKLILLEEGFNLIKEDESAKTLYLTAKTKIFHFTDDVTIRITPHEMGSKIDMRSRSRMGKNDMGTNASRIEEFLQKIN